MINGKKLSSPEIAIQKKKRYETTIRDTLFEAFAERLQFRV